MYTNTHTHIHTHTHTESVMAQMVENSAAMPERKIPYRKVWQPTLVFLPGKSPWTEEPGRLQSTELQKVGHN